MNPRIPKIEACLNDARSLVADWIEELGVDDCSLEASELRYVRALINQTLTLTQTMAARVL